jgi:murein DD-endopeptidase MepM/ murein hydrolase activator NlpD
MTVVFLCIATFLGAFIPAAALPRASSGILGGLLPEKTSSSGFAGFDDSFVSLEVPPSLYVMHDALAENQGQSVDMDSVFSARTFVRRFAVPARGINWGVLHAHNAVDIAGSCGSGVYAAFAGQVVDVREGWAGGYGNYVDIDHGNGVVTRYAHAESVLVKPLQMVASGDMVARMGNTGNSTGCHVHFEVLGSAHAPNPFVGRE